MTSTPRTLLLLGAALTSAASGYACQKTPAEAHGDGVAAQNEADEKTAAANQQAADKVAEANREAAAASDEARKTAAEAQASANEKIRDANRAMAPDPEDAHSWGQKQLDAVDNLIDAASAKAQTATPKGKAHFTTAIKDIKQQRDALKTELATLEAPAGDKLDKSKAQFTQRADRIKDHIRDLEKSL